MNRTEGGIPAGEVLRSLPLEFLERYNKVGPRYTSYPTAPEWSESVREAEYRAELSRGEDRDAPLSLYIHIPFCEHRCAFCACNVIITKKPEVATEYIEYLEQEFARVASEMKAGGAESRPVTQFHLGGGTPTFLPPAQMADLLGRVRKYFNLIPGAEMALEADPCVTSEEHLEVLAELGFNRVSFGVQDFYGPTQEIIERVQSVEETERLTVRARELGFASVNYDLVYGLPLQTLETFAGTLDEVARLRPDRIALYNFAYLPKRLAHQRYLDPESLPKGPQKFGILVSAYERFVAEGYEFIGMDHFALPGDPLARARRERTIQRNFMGYTTQAGTDLYSFGTSAISATTDLYVQNDKKLSVYRRMLEAGQLPSERGFALTDDDKLRRQVIYDLMCHGRLDKRAIEAHYGIQFDDYFGQEMSELPPFVEDGLIEIHDDRIEVTVLGFVFVRNVAMVFDAHLRTARQPATFSRTL